MKERDAEELALHVQQRAASAYWLTDAQAKEVRHIQCDVRDGRAMLATDEQMAALWKSCGL
jgi:hypothetical protein